MSQQYCEAKHLAKEMTEHCKSYLPSNPRDSFEVDQFVGVGRAKCQKSIWFKLSFLKKNHQCWSNKNRVIRSMDFRERQPYIWCPTLLLHDTSNWARIPIILKLTIHLWIKIVMSTFPVFYKEELTQYCLFQTMYQRTLVLWNVDGY